MAFSPGRWALVLAASLLAAVPVPTASQGNAAVPAEPLPEDVQLLFDLELRGPPGGASNLLPWTTANEALVAQVLCRGYLPAADPADVTVEVVNTFTFLAPAPAPATGSSRRLLREVAASLQRQAEVQQQEQGGQPVRQRPAGAQPRVAEAPETAEQPRQLQADAAAPAPAVALPEQGVAAAPAPVEQPKQLPGDAAAAAPAVMQRKEKAAAAPAPVEQPERQQEGGAAPAPAATQPERQRKVPAAEAPAPADRAEPPAVDETPRQRQGTATAKLPAQAPAPAATQPERQRKVPAAEAPAPADRAERLAATAPPALAPAPAADEADVSGGREERQRPQRNERQQQQAGSDAPPRKEQAEAQQTEMVTGVGVELTITLPSKLSRAVAELDVVEGAVTVGKLAQDLAAAGLVVDSATMVAAYVEEPQVDSSSPNAVAAALAWPTGAPAAAPLTAPSV